MLETGSSSRSKPTTTNAYVDSRFVISKTRRSTSGMMTSNFWASAQPILRSGPLISPMAEASSSWPGLSPPGVAQATIARKPKRYSLGA
jgi:hypothetical protein